MKKGILLLVALLLLGASWYLYNDSSRELQQSEDFAEGTYWMCKECQKGFDLAMDELGAYQQKHPGQSFPCSHCGSTNTVRAKKCPLCGEYYTQSHAVIDGEVACPICEQPLP